MHLLDSNTFIEAKNRYYGMTFCPAYWEWIRSQNEAYTVASISFVAEELKRGNDELAEWAKSHNQLFLDVSDEPTQNAFAAIADEVAAQVPQMKTGAMEEFMAGADPWLIAKAMATGAIVVTHEAFDPNCRKKFLIPNLCRKLGVNYLNTFELLDKLDARFVLAA